MRLAIVVAAFAVSAATASATTYLVRPDGTGDFPTIQAAISAAASGDVIELANGTFTGEGNRDIDFEGKGITVASVSLDCDSCIIDCGGSVGDSWGGFCFDEGEGPSSIVCGLTIANGGAHSPAIRCSGASPTIRLCSLVGCEYVGLECEQGSPSVDSCSFVDNQAHLLSGYGSPLVRHSRFIRNWATTTAVFCWGASVPLFEHCLFAWNEGDETIYLEESDACFENCTIAYSAGAAFSYYEASPSFSHTIIAFGAGETTFYFGGEGVVTLDCCDVFGNTGGDWVAVLEPQYGISGNISTDPLFCCPDSMDFQLHSNSPCAPESNPDCGLIGMSPVGCSPRTYVVAADGSGDFPTIQEALDACLPEYTVRLSDGVFTGQGNRDVEFPGIGITLESESGDPSTCIIDCGGSPVEPHRFARMHKTGAARPLISGITFSGGYAAMDGGAIFADSANVVFRNCAFSGNRAAGLRGGAVFWWGALLEFEECEFFGNQAHSDGGACSSVYGDVRFSDCRMLGNASEDYGGAVAIMQGECEIENSVFTDNTAVGGGGAVCHFFSDCGDSCWGRFQGCTFVRNQAREGGALFLCGAEIEQCTLVQNAAETGGGVFVGTYCQQPTTLRIDGSIVAFGTGGGAVHFGGSGSAVATCSDVYGNLGGDWAGPLAGQLELYENISADPCFCDADNDDYHLWNYSPCAQVGWGTIGAWPVGCWDAQIVESERSAPGLWARVSPNPVAGTARIQYVLPSGAERPELSIYDPAGRLIRSVGSVGGGSGDTRWDGTDEHGRPVTAGVYFLRLRVDRDEVTRKVLVAR